jgi:DNA-binding beta-propeller fold protein YncE
MDLLSASNLHTLYLLVFSIALGLGIGVSVLGHLLFISSAADGKVSRDEFKLLSLSRRISWVAILAYGFGGLGLFTLAYESMIGLGIFYASMTVAVILIANEGFFSFRHLPRVRTMRNGDAALDAFVLESGAVAAVSWIFLMFHHVIYRTDIGYFPFMALYTVAVALAVLGTWFVRRKHVRPLDAVLLKRSLLAALLLAFVLAGAWLAGADRVFKPADIGKKILTEVSGTTYTAADVALHNNAEDCWLTVDEKVFNVTEASRVHPALFNCGTDASVNYHKNHGAGIREKMMKFYIGNLVSGNGVQKVDASIERKASLKPYRELYVPVGSWRARELMFVVEKDAENLLVIDGATHTPVGRIYDVGFQPHTSVFSSDAKYMYIISRDGWLTKINIMTLEPVVSVVVGENSRGTALTDNDKYIAIGNYAPGNLVLLEAASMKIIKTIPLTVEVDGRNIESRAGAVVEDGNRIIVALKDANSVWAIDTDKPDFPVTNKFGDIGKNTPALHDAFLTPNGKHYIVASQGSKTAWVLDLVTMKPLAEVATGETPHTGPGAAWGDYVYVPSLGEGLITVINSKTWKPEKYIKTGGPGLFVRSYSKDPSYPYVWADTAFGDHKDEIYVIDARINEIVKTIIPVPGETSWHPEFTYNGKFVYVVSQSANEVEVYDAYTFSLVKRIPSTTPSAISNVGLRIEEPGL